LGVPDRAGRPDRQGGQPGRAPKAAAHFVEVFAAAASASRLRPKLSAFAIA
jgi:hypothetical protein